MGVRRAGEQQIDGDSEDHDKVVMLEVVAYPMLSPHRQQKRGGRQRVVLTAGSLWHRRRLLPKSITPIAFDTPPRVGGRDNCCQNYLDPCVSGGDNIDGSDASGRVGVEWDGLIDGVGSGGRNSRGAVRDEDREGGKREALDDLVGMAAFGSLPATGDCSDRSGAC